MICRCIDLYIHSDVFQGALGRFRQQRELLTARVSQPSNSQLLTIFFTDPISITVCPASLFQNCFCTFRIVILRIQRRTAKLYRIRECTGRYISISVQKYTDKGFLINSHGNGFTNCIIFYNRRCIVHLYVERTAGLYTGKIEIIIFKDRIACISHTVCRIDLPGLKCQRKGISIGNGADSNLIHIDITIPVIFIFYQIQVIICHQFRCHIGTGSHYDSVIRHTFIHINNTSIGFRQIVHQTRTLFHRMNGQYKAICLHRSNFQITCCTFMNCYQIFQAFLYRLCITYFSIREADSLFQSNFPCKIIQQLITFSKPWLQFHGIIDFHQCLSDTITDTCPSAVSTVGIDIRFLIFRIECGITKDKRLLTFLGCLCLCGSICTLCFV